MKAGAENEGAAALMGADGPTLWSEHAESDCPKCKGTGAVTVREKGQAKKAPCPCTGIDSMGDWEVPDIF